MEDSSTKALQALFMIGKPTQEDVTEFVSNIDFNNVTNEIKKLINEGADPTAKITLLKDDELQEYNLYRFLATDQFITSNKLEPN